MTRAVRHLLYLPRVVDAELDDLLPALPAVALDGAKGIGKTRTAERRARTVFALDDPVTVELLRAQPQLILDSPQPVLIDEWQRMPELYDLVRRTVDAGATPASYLLTGSASSTAAAHSGAGRIVRLRMRPLALAERDLDSPSVSLTDLLSGARPEITGHSRLQLADYLEQVCASGLPALAPLPARARRIQLDGYLERVVDRELPDLDIHVRNPVVLRRWLTAYAAHTATTASYDNIRDAATAGNGDKPAKTTTIRYRDALERLWLLDPLPAWLPSRNIASRLAQAPKHHLADPALAARLLGQDVDSLLRPGGRGGAQYLGAFLESLLTLSIRVYAQRAEARVHHFRTGNGAHEIDLVVERADGAVVALEVKASQRIDDHDVIHLRWLAQQMGEDLLDAAVLYTGAHAYRRPDGIAVVPAALLGP